MSDLGEIYDYSAERWGVEQADRYIRLLEETGRELAAGAKIGLDAATLRQGYRRLFTGSRVLFYKENADELTVVRVLHQRMDAANRLE